jgi:hypothetical protein
MFTLARHAGIPHQYRNSFYPEFYILSVHISSTMKQGFVA